jgi:hypothetical protein
VRAAARERARWRRRTYQHGAMVGRGAQPSGELSRNTRRGIAHRAE